MNISLATFNQSTIKLVYLDPYNNTFGEEDGFVVLFVAVLCILSIVLICSMLGIVVFVKYGIEDTEHPKLLGTTHFRLWQNLKIVNPYPPTTAIFTTICLQIWPIFDPSPT